MNRKVSVLFILLFAVFMSIPWLVPGTGWMALFGFLPLLCLDRLAVPGSRNHFFWQYFCAFFLWNAATTFWVCLATVGGGIAAMLVNSLQMSLIWALFRLSRRKFKGIVPYIFLAVMWIAWERWYQGTQISWPWLVLGNAFARTTTLVQWYEITGVLGGSLWVWTVNLGLFGAMVSLSNGSFARWNGKARFALVAALSLAVIVPVVSSVIRYNTYQEEVEGSVNVVVGQTNFDPYQKYQQFTQLQQNNALIEQFRKGLEESDGNALLLSPEAFTADVCLNDIESGPTVTQMRNLMRDYPNTELLLGASSYSLFYQKEAPTLLARPLGEGRWYHSHNSSILLKNGSPSEVYKKSKLVIGTELMPYPRIFAPIDDMLGGVMARCVGQDGISVMHYRDSIAFGTPICYESVYGEYCTGYVRKGARFLAVITNDGWWGDTPGYRQHFSYSRLRAIETRRDIARSANTGISAIIDQKGDVLESTGWWVPDYITSTVNLASTLTPFVKWGDVTGRVCCLAFLLLFVLLTVKMFIRKE